MFGRGGGFINKTHSYKEKKKCDLLLCKSFHLKDTIRSGNFYARIWSKEKQVISQDQDPN